MNTKNKQNGKGQQQKTQQKQKAKKQGQNPNMLQAARDCRHEHPEARLTR